MLQRLRKCTAVLNVKKRLGGNLENLDPPKMNKSEQVIVFEFTRLHKNDIIFTWFVQAKASKDTAFQFVHFEKSLFPPKKFYIIDTGSKKLFMLY